MQLTEFRYRDVERVYEMVLPRGGEMPRSLIIQGLPGCGVEEVFTELSRRLNTEWAQLENRILAVNNLSTFWVKPVSLLVNSLYESIKSPITFKKNEAVEKNLETELANLRTAVLHHAEQGGQLIFMFDTFDALLKFLKLILYNWKGHHFHVNPGIFQIFLIPHFSKIPYIFVYTIGPVFRFCNPLKPLLPDGFNRNPQILQTAAKQSCCPLPAEEGTIGCHCNVFKALRLSRQLNHLT